MPRWVIVSEILPFLNRKQNNHGVSPGAIFFFGSSELPHLADGHAVGTGRKVGWQLGEMYSHKNNILSLGIKDVQPAPGEE